MEYQTRRYRGRISTRGRIALVGALLTAPAVSLIAASDETERITESIEVMRNLTQGPDDGIP